MIRSNADIARGLAPARAPRPIEPGERIHVIGVAGAGASAAALLAHAAGGSPDGCDPGAPTPYTAASYHIEPDASAASYFFAAAAVSGSGELAVSMPAVIA